MGERCRRYRIGRKTDGYSQSCLMPNVRYLNDRKTDRSAANRETSPDQASAAQRRGRRAVAPWEIPWQGWKDILVRTYEQFNEDRLLAVAAGVVFYGLLALFPAITALVSSYALFAKPSGGESRSFPGGAAPWRADYSCYNRRSCCKHSYRELSARRTSVR